MRTPRRRAALAVILWLVCLLLQLGSIHAPWPTWWEASRRRDRRGRHGARISTGGSITQDRKERPRGSPRGIGCRRQIQNGLPDCAPLHTAVKNLRRARASARFRRQARRGAWL